MRLYLTIALVLLQVCSFGQETETPSSKFSFGFSFSPDYAYRKLKNSGGTNNESIIDFRNSSERPKLGITTGLRVLYQLSTKWKLELGALYSDKGEQETWNSSSNIDPRKGFVFGEYSSMKYIYHYQYIDIPLKVNYTISSKRLNLFVSGGVSTNFFLNNTTTSRLEKEDGTVTTNRSSGADLLPVNFSAMIGFGANYQLNHCLSIRLEPEFRHSITSIIDAEVKQYPYSFGVNTGIIVLLNR
tara:strand:+ start:4612 stop:5340 length:729 start_codon:yes stop_codon:yes gene_type:complete